MKVLFYIFIIILPVITIGQVDTLSGYVTDEEGEPLSFVSVYQQNTSNATLTNDLGYYELILEKEEAILFQYLGYKTIKKTIKNKKEGARHELSIQMEIESFELNTIEINANDEDPAYAIIRKAIAKRKIHLEKSQTYQADLYIKGIVRILDTPQKFMGQELGNIGGLIDSSRNGIIYLSETQSTVLKNKNEFKEILHSSIFAGNDQGFGFNQFLDSDINFYEKGINLVRTMISPLDDNALSYYKYTLDQTFIDENGALVHKIKVTPKSENRPCFIGELYITDDLFQIHSLDLKTTGKALKSKTFDSFRITQVYSPISKKDWRLITQSIYFDLSILVFKAKGNFSSVYSNYDINPQFSDQTFTEVQFIADANAIKNDTVFWNKTRPIALTEEEKNDYIRKDSLQKVWNSKVFLDSIDRVNNKFKWTNLLSGYSYDNSFKNRYFNFTSPLLTTNFNAVEGLNISFKPSLEINNNNNQNMVLNGELGYGFLDKKFKPSLGIKYVISEKDLTSFSFNIGRQITDYSDDLPIMAEISNSWHSLIFKENYVKWYQKDFINFNWQSEIINGIKLKIYGFLEERTSLENSTNYSLRYKEDNYDPNNPFQLPEPFGKFQSKKASIRTEVVWSPKQKLMIYPNRKVRLKSNLPTVKFNAEYAVPITSEYVNFAKINISVEDNVTTLNKTGYLSYNFISGLFLKKGGSFPDAFHFVGHEVIPRYIEKYQSTYKLLPYYRLDNTNAFISIFTQYHFNGFIMDKVPILKNTGWKFVVSAASLIRDDIQYLEPGVGIEGIKVGPLDVFRIDYYWGIDQNGFRNKGFKVGFINILEEGFSF